MSTVTPPAGVGMGSWFDELARAAPDEPAVICGGQTRTRAELNERANRLARCFLDLGVTNGSLVTIGCPNSIQFYEAALATWKVGAVPQPVSHRMPASELAALVEVADPALVVGLDPGDGRPWLPVGYEPDAALASGPLPDVISPSWKAPASGGSTGRPKIIMSTTPADVGVVLAGAGSLMIESGETFLCTGPLSHTGPFGFSWCALMLGGKVVLMERFEERKTLELIEAHGATWIYLVPTMMQRILRLGDDRLAFDLSSARVFYHLGAPCPPSVKQAWIDWVGPDRVFELYTGTEAVSVTVITGREWLEHPGSVGRVRSGSMTILDDDGEPVPARTVGEIWMQNGRGPTYQYLGGTARRRGDWESLGDMGWFDEDGYLYISDRRQDMVLIGGANVFVAEVEAALAEHPDVLSACVIGLPDSDMGNRLHAIVQTKGDLDADGLRTFVRERLSPYKVPRTFERSLEPLRDDAGKVRRSALRAERMAGAS
jgi:bile acid-coenzyme A ligase